MEIMPKLDNYNKLKKFCIDWGADLFGVADVAGEWKNFALKQEALRGINSAVSLGARLSSAVLSEIGDHPTKLYFHHYRAVNAFLDQLALRVSNFIQSLGARALPIPASQILDWQAQTAHLSHKRIAVLAGLGWIGRNNLLVNKKLGSRLRLITILTDLPLKVDKAVKDGCGNCYSCLSVCPAKSIKEKQEDFDHLGCFACLKEFQKKRIVEQFICGVCVNACSPRTRGEDVG